MRQLPLRIAVCLILCASAAAAQVATVPKPLLDKPLPVEGTKFDDLDALTGLYNSAKWHELRSEATRLLTLAQTAATDPAVKSAVDPSTHYVIVTWLSKDAFDAPMLARIVVHTDGDKDAKPIAAARAEGSQSAKNVADDDEPFAPDLPGAGGRKKPVSEVFFTRGVRGKIVDVYTSTREKDPVVEGLPAFVQAIAAPLFDAAGVFGGALGGPAARDKTMTLAVMVKEVGLPFPRATVVWKAKAKEPITPSGLEDGLAAVRDDLAFTEVPHTECAREFARAVVKAVSTELTKADSACAADHSDDPNKRCRDAVDAALLKAYNDHKCNGSAPTKDERDEIDIVDKKVRAFVASSLTVSADAQITFKNRPLTHWSFGAGSGVLTSGLVDPKLSLPRVTMDDGKLAADPLPRVMTLTIVNWSPKGYDAEAEHVSGPERVRGFFGVTVTPDFGVAAGINVLLVRGIGIIGGGTLMFAKGADASAIGQAPADTDQPYKVSYARGLLIGISYNFK
jgi:hypothetical protein